METNNFQRIGAVSNAQVGRKFEDDARAFFLKQGIALTPNFSVEVGNRTKKPHRFDLGSENPAVIVECKSHNWTSDGNIPSAKITVWNEAMYYFSLAPEQYRKIMFVIRSVRTDVSLAEYYIKIHGHMVPAGVEIWEFTETEMRGVKIYG